MNKYFKIVFFVIFIIIISFLFFSKPNLNQIVNDTIEKDIKKGYKNKVERVRISNGRLHLRFILNNKSLYKTDESFDLNELTNLIETNDSLEKIPNTNKCILYKNNNTLVRFNYIDYSDEIKNGIEKKIGKKIDEWNQNEIGIFTDQPHDYYGFSK